MSGQTGLRKFSTTIFKDAGTGNTNQVVADNASCEVYRQGAKVAPTAPLVLHSAPTTVTVFSVGRMAVNDTVQQNADETKRFICTEVTSSTAVKLQASGLNDIQLVNGDRLILINTPPSLYDNDQATGSAQANPIPTDSRGYVEFYTAETRFDMIVSGTGLTTTVYEDNEGGWQRGGVAWVNVKDYPTFQAAINALPYTTGEVFGGVLYIPPGMYDNTTTPAVDSMDLTGRSVYVLGDGVGSTWVKHLASASTDLITLDGSDYTRIEGIRFEGKNVDGSGRCMVFKNAAYTDVRNCWIDKFPSYGIDFSSATADCIDSYFHNIRITGNMRNGSLQLDGQKTFGLVFDSCFFKPAIGIGVDLGWSQKTAFRDCGFEHTLDGGATGYANAHVYASGYPIGALFDDCWFENSAANATPNNWFIYLKAGTYPGLSIRNCHFVRDNAAVTKARILKSEGATVGCVIDNAYVQLGGTPNGTDDIVTVAGDTFGVIFGRVVKTDLTGVATLTATGAGTVTRWP